MAKLYNVRAKIGSYEKDNETKSRFTTIGAVFESKNGLMLKLDVIPTNWEGLAYLNELPADGDKSARSEGELDLTEIPF